jgi:hypothetical protein
MKPRNDLLFALAIGLVVVTPNLGVAAAPKSRPVSAPKATNAPPARAHVEIPRSLFVVATQPSEGRNPFFPQPAPKAVETPKPVVVQEKADPFVALVLNGLTSPPKATAMINGHVFERGETAEIKLPGGTKILLKCEEIKTDSAVFRVGDQRRELRLRSRSSPATIASRDDK